MRDGPGAQREGPIEDGGRAAEKKVEKEKMNRERGRKNLKPVMGQARCNFKHALEWPPARRYAMRKDFQSPQRGTQKPTSTSPKEKSNGSSLAHPGLINCY